VIDLARATPPPSASTARPAQPENAWADAEDQRRARVGTFRLVGKYLLIAFGYIGASSALCELLPLGAEHPTLVRVGAGIVFVVVTAAVLGGLVHREYLRLLETRARREAASAALTQVQTDAALSVVTGAIAHDMRNLVAALAVNVEYLGEPQRSDPDSREAVEDIRLSLRRLSSLTAQLMKQANETDAEPTGAVDLAEVLRDCLGLTPLFARGHHCAFETRVEPDCIVAGRRQELECAVLNLLLNAVDANAKNGRIVVTLGREAEGVTLRVRDMGPGVPEELRKRIFEPFFTTKGRQGNGVGLAVTRQLARHYGGDVRLLDPGPGAEFELRLPSAA
jgi:two-component system NtrC family sensor kinase